MVRKLKTDYYLKAGWCNKAPIPIAAHDLKHIINTDNEVLVFGYIGEKELWDKTADIQMMQDIIDHQTLVLARINAIHTQYGLY